MPYYQSVRFLELGETVPSWAVVVLKSCNSALLLDVVVDVTGQYSDCFLSFFELTPSFLAFFRQSYHKGQTHLANVVLEAKFFPLTQELQLFDLLEDTLNENKFLSLEGSLFIGITLCGGTSCCEAGGLLILKEPVLA